MPEGSFGDRLTAARLRKGLSIEQVSEVLRIRPSIIEALESCNFPHMPLKGYSRNMVSSYARYVGLNSTELTEQFLREYHEFEKLQARNKSGKFDNPVIERTNTTPQQRNQTGEREVVGLSQRYKGERSYWASEDPKTLNRTVDRNKQASGNNKRSTRRAEPTRNNTVRNRSYSSHKGRRGGSSITRRPILFIVVLVVILLVILLGWALIANRCTKATESYAATNLFGQSATGTGVTASDATSNLGDAQSHANEQAQYGPFELRVEVLDEAWMAITIDGTKVVDGTFYPPFNEKYTVTQSATINVGRPNNIRVYRNGERVEIDTTKTDHEFNVIPRPIPPPNAQN